MTAQASRHLVNAKPLDAKRIGEMFVRVPVEHHPDLVALLDEIERLKWEALCWEGRCTEARSERDSYNNQLYQVRAKLNGAGRPI